MVVDATIDLAAKDFMLAKSRFNKAYIAYWHGVTTCSDDTGWKILDIFRTQINKFVFQYKRGDEGVKNAAREIFRLVAVDQADYTFQDAIGFVKWYEALKHKIGRAICHMSEYHGDSFGDLIDTYPLAGRELVERALKNGKQHRDGFLDNTEITDAIKEKHGEQWHKFIGGEHYIESTLERAAMKAYLTFEILGNEDLFPSPELQSEVNYAGHFDE